jgi:hypothetical protein
MSVTHRGSWCLPAQLHHADTVFNVVCDQPQRCSRSQAGFVDASPLLMGLVPNLLNSSAKFRVSLI